MLSFSPLPYSILKLEITKPSQPPMSQILNVQLPSIFRVSFINQRAWIWLCKHIHMFSHPGSGLQKGVGRPRVPVCHMGIGCNQSPPSFSYPIPRDSLPDSHMSPPVPKVSKTDCCLLLTNKRLLFPQKSVETYRKAWRISCYGDHG